ncbi:MAG: O-antigen ligase family protein, partial [Bacteroidia bacterium]|nr:O-antigen ligase family protein [Bacteroidia bacterium]
DLYGRYSGFYLNPNAAGFICLTGYCLSFYLKQERIKYFALALFSFAGFLTFSRYFILIWLVVTLVSVFIKRKNLIVFGIGVSSIIVLISLSAILQLNTERYAAIDEILNNQFDKGLTIFMTDSRQENWSEYYDQILDHPFFGTGYQKLMGYDGRKQGVHNAYLLTIGEAGLIPFLILIFIFFRLFKTGFLRISEVPHYFLMTVAISSYFLTSHNFYDYFPGLFILLLIYIKLHEEHVELEKSDADSLIITPSKT